MKGKPWSLEDEKKLKDWVNSGVSVDALVFQLWRSIYEGRYLEKSGAVRLRSSRRGEKNHSDDSR